LLVGALPAGVFLHEGGLHDGRPAIVARTYENMVEAWIALSLTLGTYLLVALTMGILLKEEETGTAPWIFTKPVSRAGDGLAKYVATALLAVVAAVLIPSAVFLGLTAVLFQGGVQEGTGALIALGITALHATVVIAIIMALSMVFRSQSLVAGLVIGLGF